MRRLFLAGMVFLAPAVAPAAETLTRPISSYHITLMPGDADFLGWIELRHEGKPSGYIYLDDKISDSPGHLGGSKEYIVTRMPTRFLEPLLEILREERNLSIRFFDPQSTGTPPSVFIETGDPLPEDPEQAEFLRQRLAE
jgi:hypothetical protein